LIADAILDCSARNDVVLDPFLGSGSTLLAAERVGRNCRAMELDPLYVAAAMRRWQQFTSDSAIYATRGRFDDLALDEGAMAKRDKGSFEVGFGKPPRSTQFKPGQSGNPAGRPRGAKNFATAIEEELQARVSVTENGRHKRISKREVIAKHLVNKAASRDLKAIPLLLNETRLREGNHADAGPDQVFDAPEDRHDSILRRIRGSDPASPESAPTPLASGEIEPKETEE
jgi:hypothetical protein